MSTCYILGAGFSKAVAGLPVMKDMVSNFKTILETERERGHRNRVIWGEKLLSYLDALEIEFFRKPCIDVTKGESYENCNFKENLEALVSFIDLNVSGTIHATQLDNRGRRSDITKYALFSNYNELADLRSYIQTYLYLALVNPVPESTLLSSFIDQLAPRDVLITFNYDLVVERSLYQRGRWNPKDGYGIDFRANGMVRKSSEFPTEIVLYKLHRSLNWTRSWQSLEYFYDDGSPIFPGYLEDERSPVHYEGKRPGNWLMPSFIKEFSAPGLLRIWTRALQEIQRADEIVVIGYSLPMEDSAACLLLGTSGVSGKRLTLVNPDAANLRERYQLVTENTGIFSYTDLEAYFQRDR